MRRRGQGEDEESEEECGRSRGGVSEVVEGDAVLLWWLVRLGAGDK